MSNEKIEEYKELRSEIRYFLSRKEQNLNFTIVISLGVIGVGLQSANYLLFLASSMLIAFLWFDEIRRLQAIFRTATYIQVFIESTVDDLNWETLVSSHKVQKSLLGRVMANGEYPFLFLVNSAIGIFFLILKYKPIFITIAIILYAVVFIFLIYSSYSTSTKGRTIELENWEKIKSSPLAGDLNPRVRPARESPAE